MIIESGKDYKVSIKNNWKYFRSPKANYAFNMNDGFTFTWGESTDEDPTYFPAPTILDCEVTTKCTGINGEVCPFCFPAGTQITMEDGSQKTIENIRVGDKVKSYTGKYHSVWRSNEVIETYERSYNGELIQIELESGDFVELTPNHKVLTHRGWVEAQDLLEIDDIITFKNHQFDDMLYTCENCERFVEKKNLIIDKDAIKAKSYKGYNPHSFCSEECKNEYIKKRTKICSYCNKEFVVRKPTDLFCGECMKTLYFKNSYKHHLWNLYSSMIQRCFNPKNSSYNYYGAIGLKPDDRWMSFKNFLEDMEDSWFPNATLDRIDNNKGYSKDNCRWVTKHEQRTNRRKFKNSKRVYKHIRILRSGSYFVGGPKINGEPGNRSFLSLEEALNYRNARYKEKYPLTYENYIKE